MIYKTQTYNASKAFIYAAPILFSLVIFVIYYAKYIESESFAVIGWIVVCLTPFLFQKKYKKLFTRLVTLEFSENGFLLKEYAINTEHFVRELKVDWSEVESYKFSFSSYNITYLVLYFKNGGSKKFSFKDDKSQEQAFNEKSVFSLFNEYITRYNSNEINKSTITLKPGFLISKTGSYFLYIIAFLSVLAIILHFILAPNTFMFSFMSFFIILGLLVQRKNDKIIYHRISKLNSQSPLDN